MWHGAARSNYVPIEDEEGLEKTLEPFEGLIKIDYDRHGKTGFTVGDESNDGGWPSMVADDDGNEIEFDPVHLICPFMAEGAVLVMMESGADKYREITGNAIAYKKDGTKVEIYLNYIYEKAAQAFGVDLASIGVCS
jgi:hypothetical protein